MNREAREQIRGVCDALDDVSTGLHGIVGILTALTCMYSDDTDIPSPEYMQAAVSWLARQAENLETELDRIIMPALIPCYQEQAQALKKED